MISMQDNLFCYTIPKEVKKMQKANGNGSGRYEEITNLDEIFAGINKQESAEDIGNFLIGWSEWLVEIINMVKDFIGKVKYALENNGK